MSRVRMWLRAGRWRPGRRLSLSLAILGAILATVRLIPRAPVGTHLPLSTAVASADGTLLRLTLAADGQYRLWTPLDAMAPAFVDATLLYEDRHFYRHIGVNPIALVRAARTTYVGGQRRIGGSTITMQLARRLWSLSSRTWGGKLIQIARALQLEAQYSKRQILEAYLNLAPYGGNVEGVGAASQIYFGKPPARLTLGEALTLAVIPQSPTRRAPADQATTLSPLDRARTALLATWTARMAHRSGPAVVEPLVTDWPRPRSSDALPFAAPHFVDQILSSSTALPITAADETATIGPRISRTTLDLRLQHLLERHLHAYVARARRRGIDNAAALLVDVRTTGVRALVGSADFFDPRIGGQVNGTLAPRSPGSALKPFAYGLAMDQGIIHPATMLRDVPTAFVAYSPENFDGRFAGPLSSRDALIRSRNVPALTIASRLSRPGLYEFLKTAGVDLPQPEGHYGLGLVLGTGEVTMQDLARLYAALATGGVMHPLVWWARDERPRLTKSTLNAAPGDDSGVRLLSRESAYLVLDMLADNPRPTARSHPGHESNAVPVAWKTGTSWGFRDAWAVGLFGPYVLAVWVGDFSGAGNPAFVGAEAAAPLFFELVDSIVAHQGDVHATSMVRPPVPPAGVRRIEICALSGGLPNAHCPHRRTTWFIPGRSPIAACAIHRLVAVDAAGRRTCTAGPVPVRTELFEVWPSDLAKLFTTAGLARRALPPAAPGCADLEGGTGETPRITSPLAGVTYKLRSNPGTGEGRTVALQAVTGGDAATLFWFADQVFLGTSASTSTLFWNPERPGRYTVRAVDDLGRGDARPVAIEVMR